MSDIFQYKTELESNEIVIACKEYTVLIDIFIEPGKWVGNMFENNLYGYC